ncbi:hypothetical protein HanIR_Chr02g0084511 [Helianthus annuus]|nr:hypothetical protein HanIR_Chr02g0084511 [Helianthus annuus]
MWSMVRKMGNLKEEKVRRYLFRRRTTMLERYHERIMRVVRSGGGRMVVVVKMLEEVPKRTSLVGVVGMGMMVSNLGLLLRRVV